MKETQTKNAKQPKLSKESLKKLTTVKTGVKGGMKCCMSGGFTNGTTSGCSFRG